MKLVGRTTYYTFSSVSFPNGKFDSRRYQSAVLNVRLRWSVESLLSLNSDEPVLKHFSILIAFPPRMDEMKDTVVGPDAGLKFFVNSYPFGRALSGLVQLCSFVKFSILCQSAGRKAFWLIQSFWVRVVRSPRLIVTFVHERCTLVFKSILIGCVAPDGHQYYGMIPSYAAVHSLLKARALASAHVNIRNNVVAQ